jgi:hypothetical protein
MPLIDGWFSDVLDIDWEQYEYSFLLEQEGSPFWTYPLWWLLPQIIVSEDDIHKAPKPLWIAEIDPACEYGKVNEAVEGKYIIDLPNNFGDYIQQRDYKYRKTFRNIIKKNNDLTITLGNQQDIDFLWEGYRNKLQSLNEKQDCMPYSEQEIKYRRELFKGPNIELLTVRHCDRVIACNVSSWKAGTVYDLAFLGELDSLSQNRSLGIFLILKNIERTIEKGFKTYDLLTKNYGYKHTLGAYEVKCKNYIACSKEFAKEYAIDEALVCEFIDQRSSA